jgi:hypothetical protein
MALSYLPSLCVGPFFIAFSVSYPTLALSSLPSVCVGPFSIAFSVSYPQQLITALQKMDGTNPSPHPRTTTPATLPLKDQEECLPDPHSLPDPPTK